MLHGIETKPAAGALAVHAAGFFAFGMFPPLFLGFCHREIGVFVTKSYLK